MQDYFLCNSKSTTQRLCFPLIGKLSKVCEYTVIKSFIISLMWLLLYLETVEGVKVQLIWEICQRSFIGHRCLRHDGTFGQLKHPVSARSIADVTCKVKRRLRKWPSQVIKGQCRLFKYLLWLWAHCCRSRCGSLRQGMVCWNLRCGPNQSDPAKTESRPFLHL